MAWDMMSGYSFPVAGSVLFALLTVWALVWKGLALWKSARLNHNIWFIVLLVLNTFGILEILYIYVFSKNASTVKEKPSKKKK